jgi:hypothetical protein
VTAGRGIDSGHSEVFFGVAGGLIRAEIDSSGFHNNQTGYEQGDEGRQDSEQECSHLNLLLGIAVTP